MINTHQLNLFYKKFSNNDPCILDYHEEKVFYDRSTNSAAFCALQCMSLQPPSLLYNLND